MFTFSNNGEDLEDTNYWRSDHAKKGLMYLTGNASVWRLLVPKIVHQFVDEMRTGVRVVIEPSIAAAGCWDVVFEDESPSPFVITIDQRQIDRVMTPGETRLTVWTERGKQLDLPCRVTTSVE